MPKSQVVSRIVHHAKPERPYIAPEKLAAGQEWWDALPADFVKMHEPFKLNMFDRLRVHTTAAIDTALRTSAATMVSTFSVPQGFLRPGQLKRMMEQKDFYAEIARTHDPKAFFRDPPTSIKVQEHPPHGPHYQPKDGSCVDLTFESPYRTIHPDLDTEYRKERFNSRAHARYWRHNDGPRPTIIVIHGFGADPYWLNEWFFSTPWFYKLGCDVMMFTLPFHGPRKALFSPYSGHGLFAGGLPRMNEAVGQGVYDFRIFLNYLLDEIGVPAAGVTGISLGGYHSALLAGVEERLAFSIPNVPVISLVDIMLEWEPAATAVRMMMKYMGVTVQELRETIAVQTPLNYKPLLDRERLLIIGGVADKLAPPKHARLLWEHWGHCNLHWFPGNHVLHLDQGAYLKYMAGFMTDLGFIEPRS